MDEHGDFYFLERTRDTGFIEDERTDELMEMWNRWIPAVRVAARVGRSEEDGAKISWGLAMPMAFARAMRLSFDAPVIQVPAMRCLEVFDRRPIANDLNDRGLEVVRASMLARTDEIINRYHFTPTGPSYFFVRAKLIEDGERVTYQKVLTPIL